MERPLFYRSGREYVSPNRQSWQPVAPPANATPATNSYGPQASASNQNTYIPITKGFIPHFDTSNYAILPSEQEKMIYKQEKMKERAAVVNQPHRSFPLVQPKPKPIHDYPMGSYLRHVKDPNWQTIPAPTSVPSISRLQKVMDKINSECVPKEKVVHLQYNSPLNVYSEQNIAETLAPSAKPHLEVPPRVRSVTPVDIRSSPTYQLIQEQENMKKSPTHHDRDRVYSPTDCSPIDGHSPSFPAQSHTFNTLMTSLLDHP